jgi:hypothetical protein
MFWSVCIVPRTQARVASWCHRRQNRKHNQHCSQRQHRLGVHRAAFRLAVLNNLIELTTYFYEILFHAPPIPTGPVRPLPGLYRGISGPHAGRCFGGRGQVAQVRDESQPDNGSKAPISSNEFAVSLTIITPHATP